VDGPAIQAPEGMTTGEPELNVTASSGKYQLLFSPCENPRKGRERGNTKK
jgi:hypothetical protein